MNQNHANSYAASVKNPSNSSQVDILHTTCARITFDLDKRKCYAINAMSKESRCCEKTTSKQRRESLRVLIVKKRSTSFRMDILQRLCVKGIFAPERTKYYATNVRSNAQHTPAVAAARQVIAKKFKR